jgi:phage tail protein X
MAITSWERVRIRGENIAPDLLIWRRYKRPAPGMLEAFLSANPQVETALSEGPYLPVGVVVAIPIDLDILNGQPQQQNSIRLYGDVS